MSARSRHLRRIALSVVSLVVLSACGAGARCSRGGETTGAPGAVPAHPPFAATNAGDAPWRDASTSDVTGDRVLTGVADVTMRVGTDEARLRHASIVRTPDGLDVLVTAVPVPCRAGPSPPVPYVSFSIGRGPGGRYYSGGTIGAEIFVQFGDDDRGRLVPPHLATVTIAEATASGAGPVRVGGKLLAGVSDTSADGAPSANAAGTFSATVCDSVEDADDSRRQDLPLVAPRKALTITYREKRIAATHVIASLVEDPHAHLESLVVTFANPPVLDGHPLESSAALTMSVALLGASGRSQRTLLASPQPVSISLGGVGNWGNYKGRGLPRPAWSGKGTGWLRITRAELREGGQIAGELVFAFDDIGAASTGGGSFVAVVR